MTEMYNPPHPGEIFREEYLKPLNFTVTEGAKILSVTRQTLSEFVNCRSGASPMMAKRIAKAFGGSPEFWLSMQNGYDLWRLRDADLTEVKKVDKNAFELAIMS